MKVVTDLEKTVFVKHHCFELESHHNDKNHRDCRANPGSRQSQSHQELLGAGAGAGVKAESPLSFSFLRNACETDPCNSVFFG